MAKKSWLSMFVEFEDSPKSKKKGGSPEVSSTDIDALLAETRAMTGSDAPDNAPPTFDLPISDDFEHADDSPPPPPPIPSREGPFVEARPFTEVYAEQGCVPPSPKSVDEVIVFLDGLKTMPETVQKQALAAMDNADASWTLDDVVLDARNKVEALNRAGTGLAQTIAGASATAEAEIAAQDTLIADATSTIHDNIEALKAQIVELETLRNSENAAAETAKTTIRDSLQSTVASCGRESARFEAEASRLSHFIKTFGPNAQ